ncbi:MAG: tail fiber domain-containing protein [Hydrogenophilales bacterium]|nr:tail fiber domain-containing protein [Hydrogenophilales bacterium]
MKTQISRISFQQDKRYSGVYQQQGRMITDSDWNELNDIMRARMADALKDIIGSGARGFRIAANGAIIPGEIYVDGIRAEILDSEHAKQRDFPNAPAVGANPIYYVDIWERPVTSLQDPGLIDPGLSVDTCSRTQVLAQVKWCAGAADINSAKNPANGNAVLQAELIAGNIEADPCAAELDQIRASSETSSYLFRLEVHHVEGDANDPKQVILKWSNENGAEQHQVNFDKDGNVIDAPNEFKAEGRIYEFFSEASEKHLGVHLAPPGFVPARDDITLANRRAYSDAMSKTEIDNARKLCGVGKDDPLFIRRWDGYCVLTRGGGQWAVKGWSGGGGIIAEQTVAQGNLAISAGLVKWTLSLGLANQPKSFVAGDHWLVVVRAHAGDENRIRLLSAKPIGITHHYLKLTTEAAASDDEKRSFSFPPLTDIWADKVRYKPGDTAIEAAWRDLLALPAASTNWPLDTQAAIDAIIKNIEEQDYVLVCEPPNTPTVLSLTATPKTPDGVVKLSDALKSLMCKLDLGKLPWDKIEDIDAKQKILNLLAGKLDKSGGTITGSLTVNNGVTIPAGSLKIGSGLPEAPLDVLGKVRFCMDETGSGDRVIGFKRDAADEGNAGKIAHRASWDPNALSIVGAGTPPLRKVRIWDVLGVETSIHIGPTLPNRGIGGVGRVEVTGSGAEFSFTRRGLASWPAQPKAGDRYVWYTDGADGAGVAHLWTERNGNLVDVDKDGNITISGKLTANDFNGIKIDHITGLNDKFVNIEGRLPRVPSDSRLKKNVSQINAALDVVAKLRGVSFQWREPKPEWGRSDGTVLGVIAQEVEAVLPGLVMQDEEGIRSVNYDGVTALCLQALKEQQVLIERLSSRVSDLEARLDR